MARVFLGTTEIFATQGVYRVPLVQNGVWLRDTSFDGDGVVDVSFSLSLDASFHNTSRRAASRSQSSSVASRWHRNKSGGQRPGLLVDRGFLGNRAAIYA